MNRMAVTINSLDDRKRAADLVMTLGKGMRVEIKEAKRSSEQNDCLWPRLRDISDQVDWYGKKLTETDWKDVFTAALRKARIVPNLDGDGYVQLGLHTSDLTKDEMSNLLELIAAFGAERGVTFKEHNDPNSSGDLAPPTDAPAGSITGPQPDPAGANRLEEASLLSDDWRDSYIATMSGPTTRAMSIMTRDTTALQMLGGTPNTLEREWMRAVATLTVKRDKGKLKSTEYETELERLRGLPLSDLAKDDAA